MNNNLVNTNLNTWIGSTHQDNYKLTSNFILKTSNILELHSSNFTSNVSNIIESHLYVTSNILENHSSNFTNKLRTDINKLINNQIEHISVPVSLDLTHTYVTNSNVGAEIRFWVASAQFFPPQVITDSLPYRTKIGVDGKLYVYYTFNSSIAATYPTAWLDVADVLGGIFANNVNVGITLGAIQAEILAVQIKESNDILAVYNIIA